MAKKESKSPAANGAAFPKVVRQAFAPDEKLYAGGLELRPINLDSILVLEQIESPFVASGPIDLAKLKNVDMAAAAYVLTRDPADSLTELQKGRDAFDRAVLRFAGKVAPKDLVTFGASLREHLTRAFSTAIPAGPPEEKKTAMPEPHPSGPSSTSDNATPASAGA